MAHELFTQGENNKLFVVGELGRQYFAKEGLAVDAEFKYTVQNPSLHRARVIADHVMELCSLIYCQNMSLMRYISSTQRWKTLFL